MTIQQAFNLLTETLGEDFVFKGDMEGFKKTITSTVPVKRAFANCLKQLYPSAKYVYFYVYYDIINRFNRLAGNYVIADKENEEIINEGALREQKPKIHHTIFSYLWDHLVHDVYTSDELDGEEFRFDVDTYEIEHYKQYQEPKNKLTQYEQNLKDFSESITDSVPQARYFDFCIKMDRSTYTHVVASYEILSEEEEILLDNRALKDTEEDIHLSHLAKELFSSDICIEDFDKGTHCRFDLAFCLLRIK